MNKYDKDSHRYDDMLDLKYPYPTLRKRMSREARGAQFAPFAALTGYDKAVDETARLTSQRIELSEQEKVLIDLKLSYIATLSSPQISVTYFEEDLYKEGGAYYMKSGYVKKIDEYQQRIIFEDKSFVDIKNIISIQGEILDKLDF